MTKVNVGDTIKISYRYRARRCELVRFLLSVPEELHSILKTEAAAQGYTLNGIVRQILWEWAKRQSKQLTSPLTEQGDRR